MDQNQLDQFQLDRQAGLGSTDSAAILGRSPWAGAFSVYQDKVGEAPPRDPSLPMWLGLALESTIADLFRARTGKKVRRSHVVHKHSTFDYVRCHIDCRVVGEPAVVELKTAHSTDGWGEDGSDRIPIQYWIQVQHQMLVLDQPYAYVAALFGHYDFRTYTIQRDHEFTDGLLAALVEFWEGHVVPRVPPPLDGSDAATGAVRRRWPVDSQPAIPPTPEQAERVEELIRIKVKIAAAEKEYAAIRNVLMDQLGAAAGLAGPDWFVSFKKNKPSEETAWKEVAADLEQLCIQLASEDTIGEEYVTGRIAEIVAKHTEVKEGNRPFTLRVDKEKLSDVQAATAATSPAADTAVGGGV